MFIIFVAHMPDNPWNRWVPAAFGASDSTEIFVFCSGMASALAFGSIFRDRGYVLGMIRTAARIWQVYWAHLALFFVCVAMLALFDELRGEAFYTDRLFVRPFIEDTGRHLVGLLTLNYVPNYFDILPMYMVILAMMPFVAMLGLANRWFAFALVGAMWLMAQYNVIAFSAEVREGVERVWFFNPFGWQLVFFVGFSFAMGWIKPPPVRLWLVVASVAMIAFNLVFASRIGWDNFQFVHDFRANWWLFDKTNVGLIRLGHFFAMAYLAWLFAGPRGERLQLPGHWGTAVLVVRKVGQQALPVFIVGMISSQFFGAALDLTDRGFFALAAANIAGCLVLIATAYICAYMKSEPWRRPEVKVTEVIAERRADPRSMEVAGAA